MGWFSKELEKGVLKIGDIIYKKGFDKPLEVKIYTLLETRTENYVLLFSKLIHPILQVLSEAWEYSKLKYIGRKE